jgi:hypothetical protein
VAAPVAATISGNTAFDALVPAAPALLVITGVVQPIRWVHRRIG